MIDSGGKRKGHSGSGRIWIGLTAAFAVSSLLGAGSYYGYRYYTEMNNDGFLKGTVLDGEDITGMTADEAASLILDKYDRANITITEKEQTDLQGNPAFYGYKIDEAGLREELASAFHAEKSDRMAILKSIFDRFELNLEARPQIDEAAFREAVQVKNLKVDRYPSKDAEMVYDKEEDRCVILDEVEGNEITDEQLQRFVRECVESTLTGEEGLDRSFEFPWDLCEKPSVYRDDKDLNARMEAINTYAGAKLTYVFGEEKKEYDLLAIADAFLDISDGKAQLSEEKIENFVQELASEYETRYYDRTFESTLAGEITIPAKYNDYGYTILYDEEAQQIRDDIESRTHVEREPVYLETNSWGNPYYLRRNGTDDLDGTYIEVDLTAQHVWFYKDGELYIDAPCVSGDVTDDHGTRIGCFPLAYKESPSVLTGGQGDGAYETEVQYWMPFYEGQGLHDADWRYSFGGNIYRGNGSHGCVNLPPYAAAEIYNAVETGTAIVIFYE